METFYLSRPSYSVVCVKSTSSYSSDSQMVEMILGWRLASDASVGKEGGQSCSGEVWRCVSRCGVWKGAE